jgi:menaquinone-dependent protoporphyrinogen oxidase
MNDSIAIVYATWHGQAARVAQRIADVARVHGVESSLYDVAKDAARTRLEGHAGVIIIGSVHFGRHPKALAHFVAVHRGTLDLMPTAFVSVSGAAASLQGDAEAHRYIRKFLASTCWQPDVLLSVAGAVPYTQYDIITRLVMKFAARVAGRESDTSRDYEYTSWFAVEEFARNFLTELGVGTQKKLVRRA